MKHSMYPGHGGRCSTKIDSLRTFNNSVHHPQEDNEIYLAYIQYMTTYIVDNRKCVNTNFLVDLGLEKCFFFFSYSTLMKCVDVP